MLLTDVIPDLDEMERLSLTIWVEQMCVSRYPVMVLLRRHFPEVNDEIRSRSELFVTTIDFMEMVDRNSEDEPCMILPDDISSDNVMELSAYIATYAKVMLRRSIPKELLQLEKKGLLGDFKHNASDRLGSMLDAGGSLGALIDNDYSTEALTPWWLLLQTLQATRFATKKDIELWDFAGVVYELRLEARSKESKSWNLEQIADFMNWDPAIPCSADGENWTPKRVSAIADRFETFLDHFRTLAQLERRGRHRALARRQAPGL